jgi:hypothetical protein
VKKSKPRVLGGASERGEKSEAVRGCEVPTLSQNLGFETAGSTGSDDKFLWHSGDSSEKKEGKLERRSWVIEGNDAGAVQSRENEGEWGSWRFQCGRCGSGYRKMMTGGLHLS